MDHLNSIVIGYIEADYVSSIVHDSETRVRGQTKLFETRYGPDGYRDNQELDMVFNDRKTLTFSLSLR